MKKLILLSAVAFAFAAQLTPALADATSAQKAQIKEQVTEATKTDEGCKAMCEEMMGNKKTKAMLVAMIMKDEEAMKMIKSH